jgi:hypothetical protein
MAQPKQNQPIQQLAATDAQIIYKPIQEILGKAFRDMNQNLAAAVCEHISKEPDGANKHNLNQAIETIQNKYGNNYFNVILAFKNNHGLKAILNQIKVTSTRIKENPKKVDDADNLLRKIQKLDTDNSKENLCEYLIYEVAYNAYQDKEIYNKYE